MSKGHQNQPTLTPKHNMSDLLYPLIVFFAGLAAGVINIMAGGGSTITLGVMIFMGMDASVANGTNRIGLMIESSSGLLAFSSEKYSAFGESNKLSLFPGD